jgi:hypothetical protein
MITAQDRKEVDLISGRFEVEVYVWTGWLAVGYFHKKSDAISYASKSFRTTRIVDTESTPMKIVWGSTEEVPS